jgi:tRNA U34 5-carboxymethylaminomethyl modifying GTPase MnmE/TrmE
MTNKNIEQLKQKVVDMVIEEEIDFNSLVLTNERQMQILREAKMLIEEVKQKQNESLDILAMFLYCHKKKLEF